MRWSRAVVASLMAVWVVWGSTFLAMRWAIEQLPPFGMSGLRGVVAGLVLHLVLRMRGAPAPTLAQWRGSAVVGLLFLPVANGTLALAETAVSSGFAAVGVATAPVFATLLAWIGREPPHRRELAGLFLGLMGVACLCAGTELRGAWWAVALVLVVSPLGSALGALASRRLPQPPALMAASCQLISGGGALLGISALLGERWPALWELRTSVLLSLAYLTVVGSVVGFSAYAFLLQRVRLSVAMSYAYVNPVLAVLLGAWLGHEVVRPSLVLALGLVVAGVVALVSRRSTAVTTGAAQTTAPATGRGAVRRAQYVEAPRDPLPAAGASD